MPLQDSDIINCGEMWRSRVVGPYTEAYAQAYADYQSTVDAAEKSKEAQMQMFATIASIFSTSVLMAAFAHVSINRVMMRAGLRMLGRDNTRQVVSLFAAANANSVVAFATGKLVDIAKDKLGDKGKEFLKSLATNTSGGVSAVLPLVRDKQMMELVGEQQICLVGLNGAIRRNTQLGSSQQAALLAELERSRFMQPPATKLNADVFRKKILLGMYMQKVLNGDYIMTHFPPDTRIPAQRGGGIDKLPSDPSYPKSERFEGRLGTYNTVEIDRPGQEFEEATDKAYADVYGKGQSFYGSSWYRFMIPDTGTGKPEHLKKAELVLNQLSLRVRPKSAGMLLA